MNLLLRPAPALEELAGFVALASLRKPYVGGWLKAGSRTIPRARTLLLASDRRGALRVRLGIGRGDYRVLPGLYAVGSPRADSPVLASANYKLSFDALRRELEGLDAWILVLDTKGVNVWCAAGKGSFGTEELVRRVAAVRLREVAPRATIVLPQLAGPGVDAAAVAKRAGFRLAWGPVRAADIKAFLAAGMRADAGMRRVRFGLRERIALAPVELVHAWPFLAAAVPLAGAYGLPLDGGWAARAASVLGLLAGAVAMGTVGAPALLPLLPTRSFAAKGAFLGAAWGAAFSAAVVAGTVASPGGTPSDLAAALAISGGTLASAAASAYFALNFTGSSTYTCQAGAALEVGRSLAPIIAGAVLGLAFLALSRIIG